MKYRAFWRILKKRNGSRCCCRLPGPGPSELSDWPGVTFATTSEGRMHLATSGHISQLLELFSEAGNTPAWGQSSGCNVTRSRSDDVQCTRARIIKMQRRREGGKKLTEANLVGTEVSALMPRGEGARVVTGFGGGYPPSAAVATPRLTVTSATTSKIKTQRRRAATHLVNETTGEPLSQRISDIQRREPGWWWWWSGGWGGDPPTPQLANVSETGERGGG